MERFVEPPCDEVAERALLGGMIVDVKNIPLVLSSITEEDLYFPGHRLIFRAVRALWEEKGERWDDIVLRAYLEKEGLEDAIPLIYALVDEAAVDWSLQEVIYRVKELSSLRKVLNLSVKLMEGVRDKKELSDLLALLDGYREELSGGIPQAALPARELMRELLDVVEKLMRSEKLITGLGSGFLALDTLTTGFQEGELAIIAARPGMGKSSFMLSIALHMAMAEGVPTAIFSLEMNRLQLSMRAVSIHSGVPLQNLRRGYISGEDRDRIGASALEISRSSLYVDDTPALSLSELRIRTRSLVKEKGVKVVFVDYLQLLRANLRGASRQEEVAEISRSLKALAKELNISVVALSQLSRQVEQRSDKRPQLADLRESGQIEQDADLIIFIHRPEYYRRNPSPEEQGMAELIVAKQRQGPTGIVRVRFEKDTTAFRPLDQPPESYQEEDVDMEDIDF